MMWFTSVFVLAYLTVSTRAGIIPDSFIYRNFSQYTVRYLSEAGEDSSSCLVDQGYPAPTDSIQHCRTLIFALTGSKIPPALYLDRIIVLALPGSYTLGVNGTRLWHSNHIILSRLPGEKGEVVLSCNSFEEFSYNNFYFYNSTYIALNGLVLTRCGQQSTALATLSVRNLVLSNSTFR